MIVLDCEPGSLEHFAARRGIPTASELHRVITPAGKLSAQRLDYLNDLIHEWKSGEDASEFAGTHWTERGSLYEERARSYYEFTMASRARRVGFVYRDEERMIGCSPDWLISDAATWSEHGDSNDWCRGAEVKCPKGGTHVGWLLCTGGEMPQKHRIQVQASMWITGLPAWDFVSYHPDHPPVVITVEPDPEMQAIFDEQIPTFIEELKRGRERYREVTALR